jgi:hypothetical protein
VRVQSIKRADASANGQSGKQFAGFGDLVGFFAHGQLSPDFLTLMGEAGKQMRRVSFSCPGSSQRFAIDSERIGGRGLASGPDPCREDLFKALDINLRQQPAREGTAGRQKQAGAKDLVLPLDIVLLSILVSRFPLIVHQQANGEIIVQIGFAEVRLSAYDSCRGGKRISRQHVGTSPLSVLHR